MIENCPMRHENGNCIPAGGFCTANKNICEALLNAYRIGKEQLSKEGATSDQPVATDTNVGDTISRQAAIDEIKNYCKNGCDIAEDNWCPSCQREQFMKLLKALPTVQPEPQWILCDERMPEEHEWLGTKKFGTTISDEVYVTFENPKGERFCKHLSFQNGKLSAFDKSTIDAFYKGSKPIAWMPLPKPFEGGTE